MRDHLGIFNVSSDLSFARGVHIIDNAEGTFTWTVTGTGGDDVHEHATVAAYMGTNGIHLKTRTTDSAENDYVAITKHTSYPESGLLLARWRFASPDIPKVKTMEIGLLTYTPDGNRCYGIKLDPNAGTLTYIDSGGSYVTITGGGSSLNNSQFIVMELAIDLRAMLYLDTMVNGIRSSLAGVAGQTLAPGSSRFCSIIMTLVAGGDGPAAAYIDSVYVGEFEEP